MMLKMNVYFTSKIGAVTAENGPKYAFFRQNMTVANAIIHHRPDALHRLHPGNLPLSTFPSEGRLFVPALLSHLFEASPRQSARSHHQIVENALSKFVRMLEAQL